MSPISFTNSSIGFAKTHLDRSTSQLSKTYERLSSGMRINKASDDPAGLAIADSLKSDAILTGTAIRNANDAVSVTSIMDSALAEIGSVLSRMAELAEQSANGVYTNTQRSSMSMEFEAIASEVERITSTTEFNDIALLDDSSALSFQVGIDGSSNSRISLAGVDSSLEALNIGNAGGALTFSIISTSDAGSIDAAQNALDAVTDAIGSLSSIRGSIGATESRLSYAVNYLTVARENYLAAESSIRDADIASDVADMVRLQILQQSASAVLAQANQQPEMVLELLK